jgi:hypothetical protein
VAATEPAIVDGWSRFLATGAAGKGEAAPGDHLQTAYRLWLPGHQLEQARPPWVDPYSFRPEVEAQPNPAWWPFGLPYWPLQRALGTVRAWNLFVLLGFLGAGGFACAWLRSLGLARAAALAGGLAFAIAPYRVVQSVGPLLGAISMLIPLSLWAFERRRWWISRAALVSIPLSGQVHLAIGAIALYAVYAVCRTRDWRALVNAGMGVAAAALAGVLIRLTVIEGSIEEGGRSLSEVDAYSAGWLDFLSRDRRGGLETYVFVGWLTPLAALAGLYLLVAGGRRWHAAVLGAAAVVPLLLALGTNTPIYTGLWHVFPPLQYPRVPGRLMPVADLALAALVAFTVAVALRLVRNRHVALGLGGAALVLLAADLHVREVRPAAADPGNHAYAAVRSQPGRLLELPVFLPEVHLGSVYLYYAMQARRQRPGGYSTTAPRAADATTRRLRPLSCGDWSAPAAAELRRLDVGAVTLHRGLYDTTAWLAWQGLVEHGWRPLETNGAVTAFGRGRSQQSPPFVEPPTGDLLFCPGWYPPDERGRQMSETHGSLWVYGEGFVRLFVSSPRRLRVRIGVDGRRHSEPIVKTLVELRLGVRGPRWHLVTFDVGKLPVIGGRARGMRLIAYALP